MAFSFTSNTTPSASNADASTIDAQKSSLFIGPCFGLFSALLGTAVICALGAFVPAIPGGVEGGALCLWVAAVCVATGAPAAALSLRPRKNGEEGCFLSYFRRASLCAILAGIFVLLLHLFLHQLPFEYRPLYPYPTLEKAWLSTEVRCLIAGLFVFASAFLFQMIWARLHRFLLKRSLLCPLIVAIAIVPLIAALNAPLRHGALSLRLLDIPAREIARDESIDLLIRQKGLARAEDLNALSRRNYPKNMFAASVIARIEGHLGLPLSGFRSDTLMDALLVLPDKTIWVLDGNGGGDAETMAQILALSWGEIRIRVRPGVYTPEPGVASAASPIDTLRMPDQPDGLLGAAPRGPLARVLWENAHMVAPTRNANVEGLRLRHTARLEPDPDGGVIFVEMQPLATPAGFMLSHATIKFELARGVTRLLHQDFDAALTLGAGARLLDVRIIAPGPSAPKDLDTASGGTPFPRPEPSPVAALKIASAVAEANPLKSSVVTVSAPISSLEQVEILSEGQPLRAGIMIDGPLAIVDSRFGAALNACLEMLRPAHITIVDSDISECPENIALSANPDNRSLITIDDQTLRRSAKMQPDTTRARDKVPS